MEHLIVLVFAVFLAILTLANMAISAVRSEPRTRVTGGYPAVTTPAQSDLENNDNARI